MIVKSSSRLLHDVSKSDDVETSPKVTVLNSVAEPNSVKPTPPSSEKVHEESSKPAFSIAASATKSK